MSIHIVAAAISCLCFAAAAVGIEARTVNLGWFGAFAGAMAAFFL